MKYTMISAIIFSALSLAACGGGGGGGGGGGDDSGGGGSNTGGDTNTGGNNNPPPSAPSQKLASTPQIIGYYGDSTIRGFETATGGQVDVTAPEAFQSALPSSQTVLGLEQNGNAFGVDGQTSCELWEGTADGESWRTKMANSNATVVILNHGINDAVNPAKRISLDRYQTCLTGLAVEAKAASKYVIFETPNPVTPEGLEPYVQVMRQVAAQQGLPLIDQYEYLLGWRGDRDQAELTPDGVHPTQEVYIEKGRNAASVYLTLDK